MGSVDSGSSLYPSMAPIGQMPTMYEPNLDNSSYQNSYGAPIE